MANQSAGKAKSNKKAAPKAASSATAAGSPPASSPKKRKSRKARRDKPPTNPVAPSFPAPLGGLTAQAAFAVPLAPSVPQMQPPTLAPIPPAAAPISANFLDLLREDANLSPEHRLMLSPQYLDALHPDALNTILTLLSNAPPPPPPPSTPMDVDHAPPAVNPLGPESPSLFDAGDMNVLSGTGHELSVFDFSSARPFDFSGNTGGPQDPDSDLDEGTDPDASEDSDEEEEDHSVNTSAPKASKKKRRAPPSARNPYHGHVEGALRGEIPFPIVRPKLLPKLIKDPDRCTARYGRIMRDLIARVERISHQTGAWIYVGAHHISASRSFIHYASPRLRTEAASQINHLAHSMETLMVSLRAARRTDILQMSEKVDTLEREKESVVENLRLEQAANIQMQEEIAQLKAQLGK